MKTYLSVIKLVYKSNRRLFFKIVSLSLLVGLVEGLLIQINIVFLTAIQIVLAGDTNYWKIIVPFVIYYFLAPTFYVYRPMENYLKSSLNQKMKITIFNDIFKKAYHINMLEYEDPNVYDNIGKATENITNERFMSVVESIIRIPIFFVAIISIITILNLYNPYLIILALIQISIRTECSYITVRISFY